MKLRVLIFCIVSMCFCAPIGAAVRTEIFDPRIASLRAIANRDQLVAPVIALNSDDRIEISFDELGYSASSFYYRIAHLDENCVPTNLPKGEIFDGFDDNMINDYDFSVNTTVNYVHYRVEFPSNEISFKISGNYAVTIARDNDFDDQVVATVLFAVVEPLVEIDMTASAKTLKGVNGKYQQVDVALNTRQLSSSNSANDFYVVVRQNGRYDNEAHLDRPSFIASDVLKYTENAALTFEAGNQYRTIDFSSIYTYGRGIDHVEFHDSIYHVVLERDRSRAHHSQADLHDAYGAAVVHLQHSDQADIEADYVIVQFEYYPDEALPQGATYLVGELTQNRLDDRSKMVYNNAKHCFVKELLLKQGGYSYIYAERAAKNTPASVIATEGSFWQSSNRYETYAYYKPIGARYARLVGYTSIVS